MIRCVRKQAGEFKDILNVAEQDDTLWFKLPEQCALAIVNTKSGSRLKDVNDFYPINCVACNPGWKPNVSPESNIVISSCTIIENCIGNLWVNKCSKCKPNYVYEYKVGASPGSDEILYTACVFFVKFKQCYAATEDGVCEICEPGYNMNRDNVCIAYKPSKCQNSSFYNETILHYQK